jgi:serine protease Do
MECNMKIKTMPVLGGTLILAVLVGSWITDRIGASGFRGMSANPAFVSADSSADIAGQVSFLNGFAPVAKKVLPAVVNIASSKIVRTPEQGSPFFSDPFFRRFFGDEFSQQFRMPREQRERSLGSGVIVNADGYVLTNNHVVAGAEEIKIFLGDKREFKGRIVGTDSKTDIAVVRIEAKGLPTVALGDSSKTQVGDFALAVGNPFGLGQTVTMGIIGATGRAGLGIEDYEDFIQTDAAVNPGNSGGALVNVRGELIGINAAIVAGTGGGNQGVGFAVPVNMAHSVMEEILKHGKVIRGWIGISIQLVTPDIAQAFGLTGEPRGGLVADVTKNSPAERSGVSKGDIVLGLNGAQIGDSQGLRLKIGMLAPGTIVKLKLLSKRQEREVTVTLAESPAPSGEQAGAREQTVPRQSLGLSVDQLSPQIARQLDLPPDTRGIVVTEVAPDGRAEEGGLERGDVIQEVDRKPVATLDQFHRAIREAGNKAILLLIDRSGIHLYAVIPAREARTR